LVIYVGVEDYKITFEVVRMKEIYGCYLHFLGHGFLCQCRRTTNWATKKPIITFGPKKNWTIVFILAQGLKYDEDYPFESVKTKFVTHTKASIDLGPIKCIGPGLYDY